MGFVKYKNLIFKLGASAFAMTAMLMFSLSMGQHFLSGKTRDISEKILPLAAPDSVSAFNRDFDIITETGPAAPAGYVIIFSYGQYAPKDILSKSGISAKKTSCGNAAKVIPDPKAVPDHKDDSKRSVESFYWI